MREQDFQLTGIFGVNLETELSESLHALASLLKQRYWRLGSAESCTGGGLAYACTALSGSSDWFEGSIVSYSNAMKINLLGVPVETLKAFGAVSHETAEAMVRGLQTALGVQAAVSITGIAGPTGGTANKPVGTVCFGFAMDKNTWTDIQYFHGERDEVRRQSIIYAVSQIIKYLRENK
ncbi:CinA family protein [Aliidiomarina sanyensis]|uniref:Damage-inducible protein CinA n=1 Tax=Aliidiomarina sanyensis TaxID=1249555 RepID=A0A432WRG4_9GAMM|nr:CinA family protein [Aliidiomarina sanyensis]RUO36364.1 damage-inducible protein CinA [Aliidiomarina sanyensis]